MRMIGTAPPGPPVPSNTESIKREILEKLFAGEKQRDEYTIVSNGGLAGVGAHSYTEGSSTGGSEEAAEYKAK